MHKHVFSLLLLCCPLLVWAQPKIQLIDHAAGFSRPVDIAHCGDSRLFIVEQKGLIWALDSLGKKLPGPFLDIDQRVRSTGNEQGLLGLAFHPDYAKNGYFYVNYSRETDGDTRISRFSRDTLDSNKADPNSELILVEQDQPYTNHNGGCLKFGPDGYLYVGLGDGGSGGDPQNNGQKKNTLLGKIFRIDVNGESPGLKYAIPADNPFVGNADYRPEIWSLGWRNPWRFSFDRLSGDMWIGDVGQGKREEIDFEPAKTPGRNYGWRCYEGTQVYNTSGCQPASAYIAPVYDYVNPGVGCSVTGGFVYRGSRYSELYGVYLHTDYCSGRWWATRRGANGAFSTSEIANLTDYDYSSLGEDRDGELYVAALSAGKIYKIKELCSGFTLSATVNPASCSTSLDGQILLAVTGGTAPYSYNWSNGHALDNHVYLNPGAYSITATDANGCARVDTFVVGSQFVVPVPEISLLSGPLSLCPGDTAVLTAATAPQAYGYQWLRNGQEINGAEGPQYKTWQSGNYSVQYTGGLCDSEYSPEIQITEAPLPQTWPEVYIAAGQAVLCPGDSAVLAIVPGFPNATFQWFFNDNPIASATSNQLIANDGGIYAVEVTESLCNATHISAIALELETVIPPAVGFLNDSVLVCTGNGQWLLDGEPIPGAVGASHVPSVSGYYECQIVTVNGCIYTPGYQVVLTNTRLPRWVKAFSLAPNPSSGFVALTLELERSERVVLSMADAGQRQLFMQTKQGQLITQEIDLRALPAGTYFLTVRAAGSQWVQEVLKK